MLIKYLLENEIKQPTLKVIYILFNTERGLKKYAIGVSSGVNFYQVKDIITKLEELKMVIQDADGFYKLDLENEIIKRLLK